MQISAIKPNYQNSFTGLVPIKDYHGTILKLTKEDKELIAKYEKQIAEYILEKREYVFIEQKFVKSRRALSEYYAYKETIIDGHIETLRQMIKDIKINRLNIQRANNKN